MSEALVETVTPMTPEEFKNRMLALLDTSTKEYTHMYMDDLLCEVLKSLGYSDGIAIFDKQEKYYV